MNDKIRCPICNSRDIVKRGKRKSKHKALQIYYCKICRKRFVEDRLKNKMYPPGVIISAISYYNKGHTLEETTRKVNRRYKVKMSKSSVHSWITEFSDMCSFGSMRHEALKEFEKDGLVFTKSFEHRGLQYLFRYHKAKLKQYGACFPGLVRYMKSFERGCPDEMFEGGERCSKLRLNVNITRSTRRNQACHLAGLALKAVQDNRKRHDFVEEFMLLNDAATVACELPVWFWDKNMDVGVSGHIDVVQIRRGRVYVLDFKPGAARADERRVVSQLYLYALGLSFRAKTPLSKMRCAWFDENVYYEFNPSMVKTPK